jgi:hypothetical protein
MADKEYEVPEGAAVLPLIPLELGISPLLLATLHGIVFVAGSAENVVNPAAGNEALDYIASYLRRLNSAEIRRLQEDVRCLLSYAREQKWSREMVQSLKALSDELGIDSETDHER